MSDYVILFRASDYRAGVGFWIQEVGLGLWVGFGSAVGGHRLVFDLRLHEGGLGLKIVARDGCPRSSVVVLRNARDVCTRL